MRGFASSLGARHWHAVDAFLLDWSLYHSGDKAVKCAWSGSTWDRAELGRRITDGARPARAPGQAGAHAIDRASTAPTWRRQRSTNCCGCSTGAASRRRRSAPSRAASRSWSTGRPRCQRCCDLPKTPPADSHRRFDEVGFTKPAHSRPRARWPRMRQHGQPAHWRRVRHREPTVPTTTKACRRWRSAPGSLARRTGARRARHRCLRRQPALPELLRPRRTAGSPA